MGLPQTVLICVVVVWDQADHKALDVWLLLLVHSNSSTHKHIAETLLRKKCSTGLITAPLLARSIIGHRDMIEKSVNALS